VRGGQAGAVIRRSVCRAMTAGAIPAGHAGFGELGAACGCGNGFAIAARLVGYAGADIRLRAQGWRRRCVGAMLLVMTAGGEREEDEG
jgi:hypothetical protein